MTSINTGAPHFRSIAKQHRHANYTLEKVINEAVDNIIKKASNIHIVIEVDDENRLQELKISDDYILGFESINEEGVNNPFNMGHIKYGHDDDDETSEFGVGLKAGALSASNQLSVVSYVSGKYYEVVCDFIKMEREEDVNRSYNPVIREINEIDYNNKHPFPVGSSIILSKIRETICERTTNVDLINRIKKGISDTYSRFLLPNKKIFVNGESVEKEIDLFTDPKCKPFTINKKFFVLEKGNDKLIIVKKTIVNVVWQLYPKEKSKTKDKKWEILRSGEDFITQKLQEGYKHSYPKRNNIDDMSCIDIDTTFAFYSDLYHCENNEPDKPFDKVAIYKDDRKYCNKSLEVHNNGSTNFTAHKIEFNSKKIGKELGITFNKEITMDANNELTSAITLAIKDNRGEFNADITSRANNKTCIKAIQKGIIDWKTCNIDKLSSEYREKRILYNKPPPVQPPVDPPVQPPVQPPVDPPVQPPVDPPVQPPVDPPVQPPVQPPVDPPVQPPVDPPVEPPVQPPVQPPVEPPVDPPVELPVEPNPLNTTVLLIEASELLKEKALCEYCNITLEDSIRILDFVKNILKI